MNKTAAIYINPYLAQNEFDKIKAELNKYRKKHNWELHTELNNLSDVLEGKGSKVNILLFWQIEHLGNSLNQLQSILYKLQKNNIDFVFVKDGLDSLTNPFLVFRTIEKLTAFANRSTRNKIKSGISLAQAKGKKLGRPQLSYRVYKQGRELRAQGMTYKEIGQTLRIDESTIRKKLSKEIK